MHTQITRRAALGALAATAALPASSFAAAVSDGSAPSRLAELIAEYQQAQELEAETWSRVEALDTVVELPAVRVSALRDSQNPRTVWLHSHREIDDLLDRQAATPSPGCAEAAEIRRRECHAELDELASKRRHLLDVSGFSAADKEHEAAEDRLSDAREAIFAYVPQTVDEYRARDAFVIEVLDADIELGQDQIRAIFSA